MDMSLSKFWEMVKDSEALCAAVHRVSKSWKQLNNKNIQHIFFLRLWEGWELTINASVLSLDCSEWFYLRLTFELW